MRRQHGAADFHFVSIVKNSIHPNRRIEGPWQFAVEEIRFASILGYEHVGLHHHVFAPVRSLTSALPAL